MGFLDKLKQKAEEYDVQGRVSKVAEAAERSTQQAVAKAGELAHDNKDRLTSGLDKVGAKFDERTDGRYADQVAKAKDAVTKGVDKVADQRPAAGGPDDVARPDSTDEPGRTGGTHPSDGTGGTDGPESAR